MVIDFCLEDGWKRRLVGVFVKHAYLRGCPEFFAIVVELYDEWLTINQPHLHHNIAPTIFIIAKNKRRQRPEPSPSSMLDFNKHPGPVPKCFFTVASSPNFLNPNEPPTKKKPFTTVSNQKFSHEVCRAKPALTSGK
nr:hypothetical protein CFP56_62451 [Quercus suber]